MTPADYLQLKAFARQDGALMAVLWTASFFFYTEGLTTPGLGVVAAALALSTPYAAWRRLQKFRDECLDGVVSFLRGWAFVILTFFYSSLLFAAVQFVYFSYIDQGSFFSGLSALFAQPENAAAIEASGMGEAIADSLGQIEAMRPIDLVLNIMASNLMVGIVVGVPIAALARREKAKP